MAMVRDYYTVKLPIDMVESEPESFSDEDKEYLCDLAINEARERARLYCIPATWVAEVVMFDPLVPLVDNGEYVIKVVRVRHKTTK
ncbi:MAG: hypothetical protein ACWGQW_03180 [bacterium]